MNLRIFFANPDIRLLISIAFLILNICLLVWYLFYGYQPFFHSDSATKVLLAREIVETGSYFPADWYYANSGLSVYSGHTFIVPLLSFMPAGYNAHAVSGLISSALVLSGVWFITSLLDTSLPRRVTIVAIFAAGFSFITAENLYGQVSYGKTFYIACYMLFFAWKYINIETTNRRKYSIALILIVMLVSWSNPQRAFISYILPLLAVIVFHDWLYISKHPNDYKKMFLAFTPILIGALAGFFLHAVTISGVNNIQGVSDIRWLDYEAMLINTGIVLKQYMAIFGGLPTAGETVVNRAGIYGAIRLISALGLILLIIVSSKKAFEKHTAASFLTIFAIVSLASVLFFQITTTLPDMADSIQSSRYLIPSILLLTLVTLATKFSFRQNPIMAFSSAVIGFVFLISAYPVYVKSNILIAEKALGQPGQIHSNSSSLVAFLLKNDLHYGYASYWNAGVLSVLSNEGVLVRQISIRDGLPMPMRWLSSDRWYLPNAWNGKTFLMLTAEESALIDWNLLNTYRDNHVEKLTFENFNIYVFGDNLASNLPDWDMYYTTRVSFPASKHSLTSIGQLSKNANGENILTANKGKAGFLHYGPYVDVETGTYRITFYLTATSSLDGVARLDVTSKFGTVMLAEKTLESTNGPESLLITLDRKEVLEFRVWALGNEAITYKGVSIERISDSEY